MITTKMIIVFMSLIIRMVFSISITAKVMSRVAKTESPTSLRLGVLWREGNRLTASALGVDFLIGGGIVHVIGNRKHVETADVTEARFVQVPQVTEVKNRVEDFSSSEATFDTLSQMIRSVLTSMNTLVT